MTKPVYLRGVHVPTYISLSIYNRQLGQIPMHALLSSRLFDSRITERVGKAVKKKKLFYVLLNRGSKNS